jgi:hypothetical protein
MAVGRGEYQYDVAFSFAGEDRSVVEQLAVLLRENGLAVFYDNFKKSDLWGRDLFQHLDDVYANQARFCVIFVSEAYARKAWTNHELKSAQSRAFLQKNEAYILPVRLDDTEIPGIRPTMGYLDLRPGRDTIQDVANATLEKIAAAKEVAPTTSGERGKKAVTVKTRPKKATAAAKEAGGGSKKATVVDSSGDWVLLGDTFHKAQSIEIPDDKRFVVTIATTEAAEEGKLKTIRANQSQFGRQLPFAFGNDAFVVRCESAPSSFEGGMHKWMVALIKQDVQYGGSIMESSYSNGSQSFSAEDFARMRAERILLGKHSAPSPNRRGWSGASDHTVEMFIRGSNNHLKVTDSPIQQLAKSMSRNNDQLFLTYARLLAMYYVKAGGVAEHIERLTLGPLTSNSVHVKFRGRRAKKYSNVAPEVIEVEGDCPLP